ncbi:MAG: hypothetical protein WD646_11310 [Actinomycetota bacterium]
MSPSGRRLAKDLAWSYGPIALATAIFLIMAALVSPIDREQQVLAAGTNQTQPGAPGQVVTTGPGGQNAPVQPGTTNPTVANVAPGSYYVPPGGQACSDRAARVPGDSYSPPCYVIAGSNGGATSRGVTEKDVVVSMRETEDFSLPELFASLSGNEVNDSPDSVRETLRALVDYFNERFQFWGRKIKLVFYKGEGAAFNEFLGGGKEKALADASKSAKEVKAFADASSITIPYADALSQQRVINIGSPYPSRPWYERRAPYAWSTFTNGTAVVEAAADETKSRLRGRPASYAGGDLKGKPRKYAAVAPENAEYQESVNALLDRMEGSGMHVDVNLKYKIDVNSMPNQASNIIAQLKDRAITSILCGCDPIMLSVGLAPKANEQSYEPEWLTGGLAFVDQDIISQLIDDRQWRHAFGIAYNAQSEPLGGSYAYAAYKSVRPNDEPAFGVEAYYAVLYLLALGVHMAGPNLTAQTFEQGLFNYPGGSGPYGSWHFGPGDHTTTDDFREVWWDPDRISPQNGKPGSWVQLNDGRRYLPGQVPSDDPPWFK